MQYALVDGQRATPVPRQRGVCQYCGEEMVAKCGRYVMWHWAHMPGSNCDPWWGSESEWHREWKERFPEDWREVVHFDELTGEKHVADVKTSHAIVVEFQRSQISSEEVASRESFYRDLVWVVDGDRNSFDPSYFRMGLSREPISLDPLVHRVHWWGRSRLLHKWGDVSCPVYIDFGSHGLWRLLEFQPVERIAYLSPVKPDWLVEACTKGERYVLSWLPEEEKESWVEQFHLVELRPENGDVQN